MTAPDSNFPRRMGKGMIALAFLGGLAALTFGFDAVIEKQRNPNVDPLARSVGGVEEVVLDANRMDHYVATAIINGLDVEVLVDTGATQVAVSETLARRLGLERGPAFRVSTASGVATAYATVLDSVQLGGILKHEVRASIVPGMQAPDVLLGMNFLRDLELSQKDGQLILRQVEP